MSAVTSADVDSAFNYLSELLSKSNLYINGETVYRKNGPTYNSCCSLVLFAYKCMELSPPPTFLFITLNHDAMKSCIARLKFSERFKITINPHLITFNDGIYNVSTTEFLPSIMIGQEGEDNNTIFNPIELQQLQLGPASKAEMGNLSYDTPFPHTDYPFAPITDMFDLDVPVNPEIRRQINAMLGKPFHTPFKLEKWSKFLLVVGDKTRCVEAFKTMYGIDKIIHLDTNNRENVWAVAPADCDARIIFFSAKSIYDITSTDNNVSYYASGEKISVAQKHKPAQIKEAPSIVVHLDMPNKGATIEDNIAYINSHLSSPIRRRAVIVPLRPSEDVTPFTPHEIAQSALVCNTTYLEACSDNNFIFNQ